MQSQQNNVGGVTRRVFSTPGRVLIKTTLVKSLAEDCRALGLCSYQNKWQTDCRWTKFLQCNLHLHASGKFLALQAVEAMNADVRRSPCILLDLVLFFENVLSLQIDLI